MDQKNKIAQGSLPAIDLPNTGLTNVGSISLPLSNITSARKLEIEVSLPGGEARNHWKFWAYPQANPPTEASDGVMVVKQLDRAAQ